MNPKRLQETDPVDPIELKKLDGSYFIVRGTRKLFGPYSDRLNSERKLQEVQYRYIQDGFKNVRKRYGS